MAPSIVPPRRKRVVPSSCSPEISDRDFQPVSTLPSTHQNSSVNDRHNGQAIEVYRSATTQGNFDNLSALPILLTQPSMDFRHSHTAEPEAVPQSRSSPSPHDTETQSFDVSKLSLSPPADINSQRSALGFSEWLARRESDGMGRRFPSLTNGSGDRDVEEHPRSNTVLVSSILPPQALCLSQYYCRMILHCRRRGALLHAPNALSVSIIHCTLGLTHVSHVGYLMHMKRWMRSRTRFDVSTFYVHGLKGVSGKHWPSFGMGSTVINSSSVITDVIAIEEDSL